MILPTQQSHSRCASADSVGRSNDFVHELNGRAEVPAQTSPLDEAETVSGPLHRFLERSATILFPVLFISPLLLAHQRLSETESEWLAVPGTLLGWVFGDFVTGLVHWAADTYGEESTPVIGQSLVKPFRVHHIRPHEICEHGLIETVGNTCILALPLLTLFAVVMITGETSTAAAFAVFTAVVTVGVTVATNQFHKWAHQETPPRVVRALQRSRIILSPEHHSTHHAEPFSSSYAITNGWLNPLLNRIRFFRWLERALRAFGVRPSREVRGE